MRLYHFICQFYGLKSLREKRVKISTINDMNDPFEAFKFRVPSRYLRRQFHQDIETFSEKYGILCFSKRWSNPLLWSHYADRHKGICLGFDASDENLIPVDYVANRTQYRKPLKRSTSREQIIKSCLKVKYESWEYEEEVRRLEFLDQSERGHDDFTYAPFSDDLTLREVIIGPLLRNSRVAIAESLGELSDSVEVINSRLAFNSFAVVRQKNSKPWN